MSEIISFAEAKKELLKSSNGTSNVSESLSFEDSMKKNLENQLRMQKERNKANKSVLKSYRIKPEKK